MKTHNVKGETKEDVLRRLAERRKKGKLESMTIGAKLVMLKKKGIITQGEFDAVMGVRKK